MALETTATDHTARSSTGRPPSTGGAAARHHIDCAAAGLRRAATAAGVALPVDYSQAVAADGLARSSELGVQPPRPSDGPAGRHVSRAGGTARQGRRRSRVWSGRAKRERQRTQVPQFAAYRYLRQVRPPLQTVASPRGACGPRRCRRRHDRHARARCRSHRYRSYLPDLPTDPVRPGAVPPTGQRDRPPTSRTARSHARRRRRRRRSHYPAHPGLHIRRTPTHTGGPPSRRGPRVVVAPGAPQQPQATRSTPGPVAYTPPSRHAPLAEPVGAPTAVTTPATQDPLPAERPIWRPPATTGVSPDVARIDGSAC